MSSPFQLRQSSENKAASSPETNGGLAALQPGRRPQVLVNHAAGGREAMFYHLFRGKHALDGGCCFTAPPRREATLGCFPLCCRGGGGLHVWAVLRVQGAECRLFKASGRI